MPSVGFGWLPLECADFVCCVHKEEPCVEQNCELMGEMRVYPVVNECAHRQIVRVFMPEHDLSWYLPL